MAITKTEMQMVKKKLDRLEVEVMRLRARLIPIEKISEKEKRELKAAEKRIAKGEWIGLDELTKEFG